ncbi:MAG: B-box zinc finger protein [Actinomycetota bacterium]|nr:B-box zinc finger protein [Actinomycetota bacterium]
MNEGKQKERQEKSWKACHLHPSRPAIRDCRGCGKPMCKQCVLESGDPLLCPQCKLAQTQAPETGFKPARQRLEISEITITEEAEERKSPNLEMEEEFLEEQIELVKPSESKVEEILSEGKENKVQKPIPTTTGFQERVETKITTGEGARLPPEKEKVPAFQASAKSRVVPATLGGLAAAALSFGFWMLIANFRGWTQASVFVTGIAVPWASYKIATRDKQASSHSLTGILWISLISLVIVAITTPLAEFAAFEITKDVLGIETFSGFYAAYFKGVDWALIISGVGLSFIFPLFFEIGEKYRWSLGRSK